MSIKTIIFQPISIEIINFVGVTLNDIETKLAKVKGFFLEYSD